MKRSLVLCALLAFLCPVFASYGYAVGDESTPMCWAAQLYGPAAKQQILQPSCKPTQFYVQYVNPPATILSESRFLFTYTIFVNKTALNITSVPTVIHTNIHACVSTVGFCAPSVAISPGLVSQDNETRVNVSADGTVTVNSGLRLDPGRWTILAHARIYVDNTTQLDIAAGISRDVVPVADRISTGAKIGVWAVAGAVAGFVLAILVGVIVYHNHRIIRATTLSFTFIILICGLVALSSVVPMGLRPSKAVCMARPWLIGPAVLCVCWLLLMKQWRVWRLFTNPTLSAALYVSDTFIFGATAAIVGIEIICLIVWNVKEPSKRILMQDRFHNVLTCGSSLQRGFVIAGLVLNGIVLILAAVFAFLTRNMLTLFNEAKWIGITIYNITVLSVVVIAVQYTIHNPTSLFVVRSIGIILGVFSTVAVMFLPKFYLIFTMKQNEFVNIETGTASGTNATRSGTTKSLSTVDADWDEKERDTVSDATIAKLVRNGKLSEMAFKQLDEDNEKLKELLRKHHTGLYIHKEDVVVVAKSIHATNGMFFGTPPPASSGATLGGPAPLARAPSNKKEEESSLDDRDL